MRQGMLCGILLIAVMGVTERARAVEPTLRIGFVQTMFRDIQPTIAAALAKPFQGLMEQQTGVKGDVQLFATAQEMAEQIEAGKLEVAVMHGFEYAWMKARYPELTPIAVANPYSRVLHGYVVVNQSCSSNCVADLKTECVAIPKGIKAHCLLYLDQLRAGLPADVARPENKNGLTTEEVLNEVASCKCTAALVDAGAFAGYEQIQPGAAKQLKILCKSEAFPPSVIVYKKGALDEAVVARLRNGLLGAHKTPQYKPLLLLWNLKGFEEAGDEYHGQLETTLKAFPAPATGPRVIPVSREK